MNKNFIQPHQRPKPDWKVYKERKTSKCFVLTGSLLPNTCWFALQNPSSGTLWKKLQIHRSRRGQEMLIVVTLSSHGLALGKLCLPRKSLSGCSYFYNTGTKASGSEGFCNSFVGLSALFAYYNYFCQFF